MRDDFEPRRPRRHDNGGRGDFDSPAPRRPRRLPDDDEEDRPRRPRRERDEDDRPRPPRGRRDEEDNRPRPLRRGRDEDDDDRPSRARRARDEDEDRPRRRPRDDDDEDDDRPARRRKRKTRGGNPRLILWIILGTLGGAIAAVVIVILIVQGVARGKIQAAHAPHMKDYLQTPVAEGGPKPTLKGKIVVVNTDDKNVDSVHFSLPTKLQADKPEEVGAIVLIRWSRKQVASYTNGKPAYMHFASVAVIDKASRRLIESREFQGSRPPERISGRQSEGSGSKPTDEVVNFIKGLARG